MDKGRTGKDKPWASHKTESGEIADVLISIGKFNQADKMLDCANYLNFWVCENDHKKLDYASFCKNRFCPMCSWRRSLKVFGQVFDIADLSMQKYQIRWLFLTVTVKNVPGGKLSDTIDSMMAGFNRMFQRSFFKKYCYGWFRSLEVTRNNRPFKGRSDNPHYGTYHPHYHVLLAMKPSYFKTGYKKKSEWAAFWRDSARLDYDPVVDIRPVTAKRDLEAERKVLEERGIDRAPDGSLTVLPPSAIAEVSKYTTKSKELLYDYDTVSKVTIELSREERADIMWFMWRALNNRRLYAFGGLLKQLHKLLHLQDVESDSADLSDLRDHEDSCTCKVCDSEMKKVLYSWLPERKNYTKKALPLGEHQSNNSIS